ncbi:hypothetical protein BD410DRAFT_779871 [Rickenella mellea]|uniref:Pkr1-domain-containing protein n=1 Tax=Rickenella mellea TaxID=50990 RepID=A0A4V3AZL0_9AGAM|nr:hypothetical protein BD410DRAFT_779871 [Rickenella mellea]
MSENSADSVVSFFSDILKPGSSLNPNFLIVVDGAFTCLLFVLLMLLWMTAGSIHLFALIAIELALWASVKWFINELKNVKPPSQQPTENKKIE